MSGAGNSRSSHPTSDPLCPMLTGLRNRRCWARWFTPDGKAERSYDGAFRFAWIILIITGAKCR
uniref:Uncharacterized protein n=1 Tax=uncultured bacterium contig00005 TaxID=1181497 RepID=A0A806KHN2_9BACT|nr:hypothetical protein [uncultured bacterium contig00005]